MDSAFADPLHSLVASVQAVPPEAWIWLGLLLAGLLPAFLRPRRGIRTAQAHPASRRAGAGPEVTVCPLRPIGLPARATSICGRARSWRLIWRPAARA
jgi:hypothetical protein